MWLHQLLVVPMKYKRGYKLLKISQKKRRYQTLRDRSALLTHLPRLPLSVLLLTLASKAAIVWPQLTFCIKVLGCQQQKVTMADLCYKDPIRRTLGSS